MDKPAHTLAKISQAGFQFLLRPLRAQVWQLLMDIVQRRRKRDAAKGDDLLAMVLQLSFCTLGAGYSMDLLSKPQQVCQASSRACQLTNLFAARQVPCGWSQISACAMCVQQAAGAALLACLLPPVAHRQAPLLACRSRALRLSALIEPTNTGPATGGRSS